MTKNARSRETWRTSPEGKGHARIPLLDGKTIAGRHGSLTSLPIDNSSDSELFTVAEAAQWLKISTSGLRRLQQRRLVPFVKLGVCIRFWKRDLISYIARSRIEPIGE